MTITPRSKATGRSIFPIGKSVTLNQEIRDDLAGSLASGLVNPVYGAGLFVRHLVLGIFKPISLCGRYVGDVSTAPMPTPIGVVCPACIRRWNKAMDIHNAKIHLTNEAAIGDLADEFDSLIGLGDENAVLERWTKLDDQRPLRAAAAERLDERGVDLHAVIASARKALPGNGFDVQDFLSKKG